MIRQAHSYLAGAVSSAALIGAAVVVFVVLISAQAFHDWPISGLGLGGGGDTAAVAPARPVARGSAGIAGGGATATGGSKRAPSRGGAGQTSELGNGAGGTRVPAGAGPVAEGGAGDGSRPAGGSTGSAGGGGPGGSGGSGGGESGHGGKGGNSASGTLTHTVGDTVSKVDEAGGGALGKTGLPEEAQGVAEGVAGPESPVGHAVDETAGAVGGLLHSHH